MVTATFDDGPLKGCILRDLPDPPPKIYTAEELVDQDKLLIEMNSTTDHDKTPLARFEKHPHRLIAVDEILTPTGVAKVAHYSHAPDLVDLL